MELSLRQKQILELLSINCRFSNRDIAKSLRCSEDTVDYQIKKLIEEEKLARFYVQFDYYLLGYRQYHIWIRLGELESIHENISDISSIISVNESYGKYDLQVVVLVKSIDELQETIKSLQEKLDVADMGVAEFGDYLRPFTNIIPPISVQAPVPKNKKNPVYLLSSRAYSSERNNTVMNLDEVDKKIISILIKDPRIKFSDLAERSGLNHETARYRIAGYVKRKFILNFGLLHDFQKYGLYAAYLLLNVKTFDKSFSDYLEKEKNVFYGAKLTGAYSGILYLVSHNPEELGEKLKNIRKILGEKLISFDLIQMEKIYKYVQFPKREL